MKFKTYMKKITQQRIVNEFLPRHKYYGEDNGKSRDVLVLKIVKEEGWEKKYSEEFEFRYRLKLHISQKLYEIKKIDSKWYMRGFTSKPSGRGHIYFYIKDGVEWLDYMEREKGHLDAKKNCLKIRAKDTIDELNLGIEYSNKLLELNGDVKNET